MGGACLRVVYMGQAISPLQTCQNDGKRAKTNAKMQEHKTIGTDGTKKLLRGART